MTMYYALCPPFIVLALWYISWCIRLNLVQDTSAITSLLTGSCCPVFSGIVHRNVLWRPLWFIESCKFVYMVGWFCFLFIHLFLVGWFCFVEIGSRCSSTWPHIWFSCLSLLSARMTGRGHNTWLPLSIWAFALFHCSWLLRDSL